MFFFEEVAQRYKLGKVSSDPTPVTGGLLHKLWKIEAESGHYALKVLNPTIIKQADAYKCYSSSEKVATFFANHGIPAVPAIELDGFSLQMIDGQTVMLFPWIKGPSLGFKQITEQHGVRIGTVLKKMHSLHPQIPNLHRSDWYSFSSSHWPDLATVASERKASWSSQIAKYLDDLTAWSLQSKQAGNNLTQSMVISHRDCDLKNVLWIDDSPILVDWESAGLINPVEELITVALEWSGISALEFKEDIFSAILSAYSLQSITQENINTALDGQRGNCLNWLSYNMSRSLTTVENSPENRLAVSEVFHTFNKISFLVQNKDRILNPIYRMIRAS